MRGAIQSIDAIRSQVELAIRSPGSGANPVDVEKLNKAMEKMASLVEQKVALDSMQQSIDSSMKTVMDLVLRPKMRK